MSVDYDKMNNSGHPQWTQQLSYYLPLMTCGVVQLFLCLIIDGSLQTQICSRLLQSFTQLLQHELISCPCLLFACRLPCIAGSRCRYIVSTPPPPVLKLWDIQCMCWSKMLSLSGCWRFTAAYFTALDDSDDCSCFSPWLRALLHTCRNYVFSHHRFCFCFSLLYWIQWDLY